ncbi:MAG: DUF2971 domain-containing protein [Paludibacter sp.]|nr:DUF2971 domain-containing protein [Paludibacter sp.]
MNPTYLYHYTSIENLALILNSKKLLFTNLKNVDDLSEGSSEDLESIGKYYFISCWTDLEEESIPFWNMYTPQMKGVRIKMPIDFFKTYKIDTDKIKGINEGIINSIVPQSEAFTKDYWINIFEKFPQQVKYTNNKSELTPKVLKKSTEGISGIILDYEKLSLYKSEHWRFQSEWRYIIMIIPTTEEFSDNIITKSFLSMSLGAEIPFNNFFAEFDEEKFKEMVIKLGPRHSEADKLVVESLIQRFNPTAKLEISDLYGKIK